MADYHCPKCSFGFPEKAGKVRVNNPNWLNDPDNADSRTERWIIIIDNLVVSAFKSVYYIQCPECGHKMGESDT